jgi:hypothetical protein
MIRKQRNNKNIIVEDLYVGNTLYEGDNILKGWHEHFHNLAQPSDNPDFDTRFKQQCQQDYNTIKSIYDKIIPKVVTMDELKEAIKAILVNPRISMVYQLKI